MQDRTHVFGTARRYTIRFSLWAFQYDMPTFARASHWVLTDAGVIVQLDATLTWADGECLCAFAVKGWID